MKFAIMCILALCALAFAEQTQFRSPEGAVQVEAFCPNCLPTADFTDSAKLSTAGNLLLDITVVDSSSGQLYRMPIFASDLAQYAGKNKQAVAGGTTAIRNVRLFKKMMKDFKVTRVAWRNTVTNEELQQKGGTK